MPFSARHRLLKVLCLSVLLPVLGFARISPPGLTNSPPCTNCPPITVSNSPPYSVPGLKLYQPVFTNSLLRFTLLEHDTNWSYDLYFKTSLASSIRWQRIAESGVGNSFIETPQRPDSTAFFALGTLLDSDADGLPDAFEQWVTLTSPTNADSNGNGVPDGLEDSNANGIDNLGDYSLVTRAIVTVPSPTATEGGANGEFNIRLPKAAATNGTPVYFNLSGSTDPGDDYLLKDISGNTLSNVFRFNAGATVGRLLVTAVNNTDQETWVRDVILTLDSAPNYPVDFRPGSVRLIDNDLARVAVFASDPDAAEPVGGVTDTGEFRFVRYGLTNTSITVGFGMTGTAANGTDYNSLPVSVVIPAGLSETTLTLTPKNNGIITGPELATLTLKPGAGYTTNGSIGVATVTIADANLPSLTITAPDDIATEAGPTTGYFRITRTGATTQPLVVSLRAGGDASAGIDYVSLPTSVTINAGATFADVVVTPVVSATPETIKYVRLGIQGSPNYRITSSTAVVWIDDSSPTTYEFRELRPSAVRGSVPAMLEITRYGTSAAAANLAFTAYQASGPLASQPLHYSASGNVSGANITFAARASVAVMNIGAGSSTANSGVSIQINHSGGLYSQLFSFIGSDRALTLSAPSTLMIEGGAVLRYTVSRPATGSAVSVPVVFSGLAQNGVDFTATALTLNVGQASGFVDITPLNDATFEGYELLGVEIDPTDIGVAGVNGRQASLIRDAAGNPDYLPERDYDADGLTDRQEIARGTDPFVFNDFGVDTDNDGLAEFQEVNAGSNPAVADSDGDGVDDGTESALGANPASASDDGMALAGTDVLEADLYFGDLSGNRTNRYYLFMWNATNSSQILRTFTHAPGAVTKHTLLLPRGNEYRFGVRYTPASSKAVYSTLRFDFLVAGQRPTQLLTDPGSLLGKASGSSPQPLMTQPVSFIVPRIDITFTNLVGFAALDANPNWGGGQRFFPDDLSPTDTATSRNKVRAFVRVTPNMSGRTIRMKPIDVDDPTPENFDSDGWKRWVDLGDTSAPDSGDDNRGNLVFPANATTTLSAQSTAEFELTLPMQPGDNLRLAVGIDGGTGVADLNRLQVANPTNAAYVATTNNIPRDTLAGISPMLTIWRKLHLEFDSMLAPPTDTNSTQLNRLLGKILMVSPNAPAAGQSVVYVSTYGANQGQDFNFQFGRLVPATGSQARITSSYSRIQRFAIDRYIQVLTVEGALSTALAGQTCEMFDDDDQYLQNHPLYPSLLNLPTPLPANGRSGEYITNMQATFGFAYIKLVDANAAGWNTTPTIPFLLHDNAAIAGIVPGIFNGANLQLKNTDRPRFWAYSVGLGYQPLAYEDGDVDSELPSKGINPKYITPSLAAGGVATVYLECIREEVCGTGRDNPINRAHFNDASRIQGIINSYKGWTYGVMAHEISHAPGSHSAGSDHGETGLMAEGAVDIFTAGFAPATIQRLRQATSWTE